MFDLTSILVRLPFYIAFGLVCEILFTGIIDLLYPSFLQSWKHKVKGNLSGLSTTRDARAMGYTFLWMIPIYAGFVLMEPFFQLLSSHHFLIRGFVYLILIWTGEFISGFIIKKITGFIPWDYSYSRFSFYGYIRWDFAAIWFIFSLILEKFSQKLILLTPYLRQIL